MRDARRSIVPEILLGIALLACIVPIAWMVVLAFQPSRAIIADGWQLGLSTDNIGSLFGPDQPFAAQLINSGFIVIGTVVLCLSIGTLAGYSLACHEWSPTFSVIILGVAAIIPIVPPMALVPGLYATMQQLGLLGTVPGLIALNTVFNLPFAVLLMRVYFGAVPVELREAALMDGASEATAFLRILLPVVAPGLVTVGMYTAIMTWNEFLFGLTMTSGGSTSPVTVGIATLLQPDNPQWGEMAAAGAVTALPLILMTFVARKRIVAGFAGGAVKG